MAHGHPDWGVQAPTSKIYSMLDLGEVVVRLGAVGSVDRLGNVLVEDDFRNGIARVTLAHAGVGGDGGIAQFPCRFGGHSVWLETGTGANPTSHVDLVCAYVTASRLGFEVYVAVDDEVMAITLAPTIVGNGLAIVAGVRINPVTSVLGIWAGGGVYTSVATDAKVRDDAQTFNVIKVVIDAVTGQYIRIRVNDKTYDVSAYTAPSTAWGLATWLQMRVYLDGALATSGTGYVDGLIVTENEP